MAVHTLMMAVVYFTHIGSHAETSPRLSHLHALLDSGALEKFAEGIVEVCGYMLILCSGEQSQTLHRSNFHRARHW